MDLSLSKQTCRLNAMKTPEGIRASDDYNFELATDYAKDWANASNFDNRVAYVNTPQTAADMESILAAIGQQDMLYWGWSYGTSLGQTYASLYPQKVRRMIVDGVSDNFQRYSNSTGIEDLVDADHVYDAFLEKCIVAGSDCALTSIARTQQSLRQKLHDFGESLDRHPKDVFAPSLGGCSKFDYTSFWNVVFNHLYSSSSWRFLAQNIASAMTGNMTGLYSFADYNVRLIATHHCPEGTRSLCPPTDNSIDLVNANDALTGPEHWPGGREALLDELLQDLNVSSFAQVNTLTSYVNQQWKIPRTHSFSQPSKVETQHPLLILSTSYDPICPLQEAKTAVNIFEGSRLIELEGYGHTTGSLPSPCVTTWIKYYLSYGALPEKDTKCQVHSMYSYFPEMDEHGAPRRLTAFGDPEDERIYSAQLRLADKLFKLSQRLRVW